MDDPSAPQPPPPVVPPAIPPVIGGQPLPPYRQPGPPPPPPPRGRRSLWPWIFGSLALIVLMGAAGLAAAAFHGLAKFGAATSHGIRGARTANALEEVVIEDNDAKDKLVVIDLDGVISGEAADGGVSLPELIRLQLDRAGQDDAVKAVILRVDSPGGEVLASDEIYRTLAEFQEERGVPVVTSMGSLAASGGYYISAASRWIVANELTITGSIGVIFHNYNYRGLMDKVGVLPQVVKSGKLKDMLSPDKRPEDQLPEERKILEDMINDSFSRFKAVVNEGRSKAAAKNKEDEITEGKALAPQWEDFADGRILSGRAALDLGLVDELGNFDTAVERAKWLTDVEKANLVSYEMPAGFTHLLRLFGKSESSVVKVNVAGLELGSSLAPGRLYFISPVHIH